MQLAAAAMMMRINAITQASVCKSSMPPSRMCNSLANVAAGVGQNLNISV